MVQMGRKSVRLQTKTTRCRQGGGLEFPMFQDDTCHTGIMFAPGCLLMRWVFWREQKVRRRTFGPLGHIMQCNSKIPFLDIPEETDSTAFGKGGRERILLQLNFALQELRAQGLQKRVKTCTQNIQNSFFACKLQSMWRTGNFCEAGAHMCSVIHA